MIQILKEKPWTLGLVTLLIIGFVSALLLAAPWAISRTRLKPIERMLGEGIRYQRLVFNSPRKIVAHIVTVDLRTTGLQLLVTPCRSTADPSCPARTTTKFLADFDLQVAINGDGFTPWHSNHLLDYYPHSGDFVEPIGLAASRGEQYSAFTDDEPVLYISRTNQIKFNSPIGKLYHAISGNLMLVEQGRSLSLPESSPEPRSAVGIDRQGKHLILIVVDGRQPGYSLGVTLEELGQMMIDAKVQFGMNLDGGGSSALAGRNAVGLPQLLNSPVNHGIPGLQRPVANHLGIAVSNP